MNLENQANEFGNIHQLATPFLPYIIVNNKHIPEVSVHFIKNPIIYAGNSKFMDSKTIIVHNDI